MTWTDERNQPQARVLLDSINTETGDRITTLEVTMHRFVMGEFLTHRTFSRNSESSRAVPFKRRLEKVMDHPAIPVEFRREQKGMSGGELLTGEELERAREQWLIARDAAVDSAQALASEELAVHKSLANRLLEPFIWHTVIVTATEWDGFWRQRCHPAAQPELRVAAEAMREAYAASTPRPLMPGSWHLPMLVEDTTSGTVEAEFEEAARAHYGREVSALEAFKRVSAARCARVSYVTHDGVRDLTADLTLYDRLVQRADGSTDPHHWSPLEHVATPCRCRKARVNTHDGVKVAGRWRYHHDLRVNHSGNFRGWDQLRHDLDTSPYQT